MPPCAAWNSPWRFSFAPVKAPFSMPNSSDSRRVSGNAPQLMVMNGLRARAVFMNGARHEFFAGSRFPGDEDAARLRRDGHDHVKNRAHLAAVADDVVLAGKPP